MEAPKPRTVAVTLTRDDFLLANAALQSAGSQRWTGPLAAAGAAALGFALIAWPSAVAGFSPALTVPLALLGALAGVWLVAARVSRRRVAQAVVADGAFLRPFTLTADANGLVIESAVARTDLSWKGVLGVEVTPEQILLRTDGASAIVIPRAAFSDIAAMRAFADHVRTLRREGGGAVWGAPRRAGVAERAPL